MDDEKVKAIVKRNFDESAEKYAIFEEKYHFFKTLTGELSRFCGLTEGMSVLDVGCGTGASTFYLYEEVHCREVVGIDISERMISQAMRHLNPHLRFICGDAERLSDFVCGAFDAILYNATIFILPNPAKSLRSAKPMLKDGGVCGASYLSGIFSSGVDILEEARRQGVCGDGRVVTSERIEQSFHEVFGDYELKSIDIPVSRELIEEFHLIPAQSASLFPRRAYSERITLVRTLFSEFKKRYSGFKMRWNVIKATG
jgi:ubiquinone/menaquinone biosynthesis C-methylase UbiE